MITLILGIIMGATGLFIATYGYGINSKKGFVIGTVLMCSGIIISYL